MTSDERAAAIESVLADLLDHNAGAILASEVRRLSPWSCPTSSVTKCVLPVIVIGLVQRRLDRDVWVWCLPHAISYRSVQGASARRRELARRAEQREIVLARIRDERRREAARETRRRLRLRPTPIPISEPEPSWISSSPKSAKSSHLPCPHASSANYS